MTALSLEGRPARVVVEAEPQLNATAACVLGFLHRGAMSGWELARCISAHAGPVWNVTRSQIYRELHTLESRGMVSPGARGLRERRPYTITSEGRAAFLHWLSRDPDDDVLRSPLGLAVFFADHLDPALLQRFVTLHRLRHEQALSVLQATHDSLRHRGDTDPWLLHVQRFGIEYRRTVLHWLDGVPTR